ncbi:MAG: GGGtGRT protein, partial [Clostridia bacterium]|nr:GGGtGRT protein [Clostridia bacterium]
MALFENYEGRMPQLQPVLDKYGFNSFEDVKAYTNGKGVDAYSIVESTQPICFENVKWAYELGAAIAMKENAKSAAEAAKWIGVGLQAFC